MHIKSLYTITLLTCLSTCVYADGWDEENAETFSAPRYQFGRNSPQSNIHQISEALGYFIGQEISKNGLRLEMDSVVKGIKAAVAGQPAPMTEEEYEEAVAAFRDKHFQEVANFNLTLADAFMASNAKRQDIVQVIPGRVQYSVLQRGKGQQIETHSTPLLKFSGRFIDGSLFTTTDGDKAIPVPLDDMIPGFREGVVGMREGERRRIFVHPEEGYGVSGDLAPNSLLLFEVEAVKIIDPSSVQKLNRINDAKVSVQKVALPRDDWDLTLEDDAIYQDDDDFSSQRLILERVPQKNTQKQAPTQRQRSNNRNR